MEKLRTYIRAVMKEKNLKGIHIQARSGNKIKDSTISDILSGKVKSISVDKLNALAKGLGVDGVELYKAASGEETDFRNTEPWPARVLVEAVDKIVSSPDLTEIVQALLKAKPAKIKAVKKVLQAGKE
ncbi:MAG TPA: helix-turn-helix transcriptional regulator [Blastocatellia bacterium]|nr:helix-turn-helix transcriptional regulator [Blastocatellia bacterium]